MRAVVALIPLLAAVACAPPELDQAAGDPQIRIVHPPPGESTAVQLDADCSLRLLIVVSIDNFDVRAPGGDDEGLGGHWHAEVEGRAGEVIVADGGLFADVFIPAGNPAITPLSEIEIEVDLRDDQHQLLSEFSEELTEDGRIVVVGQGACP